jgi:hypothetical protein
MTRRERLERKLEKRHDWAEGRQSKANAAFRVGDEHRDEHGRMDWALVTQPGHIPERARINRAHDRGHEHLKMAQHHEQKAAGLAAQLDRAIFSDDSDALEQLAARISKHEAERERNSAINAAYRKLAKSHPEPAARLIALKDAGVITADQAGHIARGMGLCPWQKQPIPPYVNANLGTRIKADRDRMESVKQRAARTAKAAASGGVVVEESSGGYCVVTFDEKPAREVLDALKAAGFWWSKGSWAGKRDQLPACVGGAS